ncbi:MAG: hypothetical protein KBT88_04530 [Gammaproteobacteria bacterium]|nr:hypothetical protein [Gammaproteobacteria bacterium]MBQ0839031.1 hypothetical protein [Gammaproteobacteria bacterium]
MSAAPEQKTSGLEPGTRANESDSSAPGLLARYRGMAVQRRRLLHIVVAALLLFVSSWLAFTQQGRPLFSTASNLAGPARYWQIFAYPLERNAFHRLPVLSSDLNDVFALSGSQHVWAVGQGGLILYSANGGRCWQQQHPVKGATCGDISAGKWSLIGAAQAADAAKKSDYSDRQIVPVQQQAPVDINPRQTTKTPVDRAGKAIFIKPEASIEQDIAEAPQEQRPEQQALVNELDKNAPRLNAALKAVYFIDAQRGWAVGEQGLILSTLDGGQNWRAQTLGAQLPLSDVVFNKEASQGWLVGVGGRIFTSLDGGTSWRPQNSGTRMTLLALSLNDGVAALCVVGQSGLVLTSSDGGESWQQQNSETDNTLTAVSFVDAQRGWAVGSAGSILNTTDGGIHWDLHDSATDDRLRAVDFNADSTSGWAVGDKGRVLTTVDGGLNWALEDSGSWTTLLAVSFADALQGWAVGKGGTLLFTNDSGANWQLQSSGTSPWFQSLAFPQAIQQQNAQQQSVQQQSAQKQNVASAEGASLNRGESGASWHLQNKAALAGVEALSLHRDVQRGWAAGPEGHFFTTNDAGDTWTLVQQDYSRWPAPWYYAAVLVSLLLALAPIKAVAMLKRQGLGIEERGETDLPIETQLQDKLDFWPVSQALSKFLRNRNTQPPLTVAITGAWGSGKSSLMNLLKADLARSGVQAVWFNAWHHESEEQYLLPALLQNIRQQAIPPLLSFNGGRFYGIRFRARLLWKRLKAHPLLLLLLLSFVVVNTGFVIVKDRAAFGPEQLALAHTAFCQGFQLPELICSHESKKKSEEGLPDESNPVAGDDAALVEAETPVNWLTTLINLLLGGSGGAALLRGLRAFGISPARLAKEIGVGGERQIEQRMAYRHNFQREFSTVTDALSPRTMLILIDDLDRCQPKTVVQILEAVNFLTSAGRCYVVLGMAREMVEPAVGLAFKDIADEITHHRGGAEGSEQQKNGYAQRREFAQKYLEKLINLEIPVPTVEASQALRLLGESKYKPTKGRWRWSAVTGPALAQGALFLVLSLAMLWFGNVLGPQSDPEALRLSKAATGVDVVADGAGLDQAESADLADFPTSTEPVMEKPAEFIPGAQVPTGPWLPVLAAALIFALGSYRVMRKLRQAESEETVAVIDDSEPFSRALRVWNPVIASQLETPRELCRFMNRLRYSAVRLNGMTAASGFENTLSEEEVVSLAALYLLDPDCIELTAELNSGEEFLQHLTTEKMKKQRSREFRSVLTEAQFAALGQAIGNYTAKDGIATWDFDNNKINIFKVLLQGVKVH